MIIILFTLLSAAATAAYVVFWQLPHGRVIWWSIPLVYLAVWAMCLIIFIIFISVYSLFLKKQERVVKPNKTLGRINYYTAKLVQSLSRVELVFENAALIPKDQNFFLVHNHQSNLDPIVVLGCFPGHLITYIMKNNLMKTPVIGRWLKASGHLPLDRKNDRKALETVSQAAKRLQNGYIIGACPEGTRSKGPHMNEYRSGVFKIPQKGGAPILVVMVDGFYKIKKQFPLIVTKVIVRVCELIPYDEIADAATADISERVRTVIQSNLDEARAKHHWLKSN